MLPICRANKVRIVTNMGAANPLGAAETTRAIARKLSDDLRTVLSRPELVQKFGELNSLTRTMSPPELAEFIEEWAPRHPFDPRQGVASP